MEIKTKRHNYKICKCASCKAKRGEYKGKNNPFYSKKHTEKTKRKMSKNHADVSKEKNPNFENFRKKTYYCFCGKKLGDYRAKLCNSCTKRNLFKNPKKHPHYIDGRSFKRYSINFNKDLKTEIYKRDNYQCKNCGVNQENHIKLYKEKLHIHHIDYNKKNSKKYNLITLCHSCHSKTNHNRDYWYAYYKEKLNV